MLAGAGFVRYGRDRWSTEAGGPAVSKGARVAVTLAATVVVAALIAVYVAQYVSAAPPSVTVRSEPGTAQITLQTVASVGFGPHPTWVSYFAQDRTQRWVHSTDLHVPAHSLITVTIYQFDTPTGLRNPFWSQPQGVIGNVLLDGKPLRALDPTLASHTFAIPGLGVSVPLEGVDATAPNQCANAPCPLASAHHTITFQFRTGAPGRYRWQCFVPCGAGYQFGFGGPMQTVGYMDGFMEVA
jgi:hypothetical protein